MSEESVVFEPTFGKISETVVRIKTQKWEDVKSALKLFSKILGLVMVFIAFYYIWSWYFLVDMCIALPIGLYLMYKWLQIPIVNILILEPSKRRIEYYGVPKGWRISIEGGETKYTDQFGITVFTGRKIEIDKCRKEVRVISAYNYDTDSIVFIYNAKAFETLVRKYENLAKKYVEVVKMLPVVQNELQVKAYEKLEKSLIELVKEIQLNEVVENAEGENK